MSKPGPSGGKKPYGKRWQPREKYRVNERIRVPKIRVIGPDGAQLGVLATKDALQKAKEAGLDLVEVSAQADPPVCRILDYGKFKYEESKKKKSSKTANVSRVKETKFRVSIEGHDYFTKLKRAEAFGFKGHKLKLTLMLRGREMGQKDRAFEVVKKAVEDLAQVATPDNQPRMAGRNISVMLTPLPANKRSLRFNAREEAEADIPDDHEDDEHCEE